MNLLDFTLWTIVLMLPGFLLSRLFMFISGGWRDLLLRLFVSHCAAILCIGNLAIMILKSDALPRAVLMTSIYMGIQIAWFGLDVIRKDLGKELELRFSWRREIATLPLSAQQAGVEPAE